MRFSCKRRFLLKAMIIVLITVISYLYLYSRLFDDVERTTEDNYLRPPDPALFHSGYLVDTKKCRIPNVNIWNEQIQPFIEPFISISCRDQKKSGTINGLTFVKKQAIVINRTMLESWGRTLHDIECCYEIIERVKVFKESYVNSPADDSFKYSEECYPMTSYETIPQSGFIKVTCKLKGFLWNSRIHSDYHLLASFEPELKSDSSGLHEKLKYWREHPDIPRPPNVLLLGLDSTSRMNLRRMLPRTRELLETQFGAIEMQGYTKVGENTFPNFIPLISSYSQSELKNVCFETGWIPQDKCPYIWRNYSAQNYLTSHIEECPTFNALNFLKAGFVDQPVDIYPRSWMLAAYGDSPSKCIDSRRPDQIVIRYVEDLVELAGSHGIPYFITTWITELLHGNMNHLRNMDDELHETLLRLQNRGFLNNSVLILIGDHGYRFNPERRTYSGWFEDKLPALWVALPESLKKRFPTWVPTLEKNSKQLSSPFDVHQTLHHILERENYKETRTKGAQSLLEELPPRSCDEAKIPFQYCACAAPMEFRNDQLILKAAQDVLDDINSVLSTPHCANFSVDKITASAAISFQSPQKIKVTTDDIFGGTGRLVVGVRAAPGGIEAEAMLGYNKTIGKFQILDSLRTSDLKWWNRLCKSEYVYDNWCQCKWFWWLGF